MLNLCMNCMVHVCSIMWRIKNQPSHSISCSDNVLRLLVLMAGRLYWGLQGTSSYSIWGCVLKGCFERGIYILKGQIAFEGHWWLQSWTLIVLLCKCLWKKIASATSVLSEGPPLAHALESTARLPILARHDITLMWNLIPIVLVCWIPCGLLFVISQLFKPQWGLHSTLPRQQGGIDPGWIPGYSWPFLLILLELFDNLGRFIFAFFICIKNKKYVYTTLTRVSYSYIQLQLVTPLNGHFPLDF